MTKKEKTTKPSTRQQNKLVIWFNYRLQAKLQKRSEINFFLEEVAMLIDAGLDISGAVTTASEDVRSKSLRLILKKIEDNIATGMPIWRAFQESNLFQRKVVALVRVGEESGRLPTNLKAIVEQQRKDALFKSRIQSAMMYPVLVLGVTVIIGVSIAWFILPRLADVFDSLDLELPLITKVLIWVGLTLQDYGEIIIPAFLGLVGLSFYLVFFFSKTKFIGEGILLKLPGIRKLIRQIELSRFGFIVGGLMNAGLPIDEALDSLTRATTFRGYRRLYMGLTEAIQDGQSFEQFFEGSKRAKRLLPNSVKQMVHTAELSGELPNTLVRIGSVYEEKIEGTTKNLSVILEPILLVIVWLGVVSVALAVVLPIYGLIGNLTDIASPGYRPPESESAVEVEVERTVDPVEVQSAGVVPAEGPVAVPAEPVELSI